MVPWWQVAHPRSFLHFSASFSKKANPRSITFWGSRGVRGVSGGSFLGSSARDGLAQTHRRQTAAIATGVIQREYIEDVLSAEGHSLTGRRQSPTNKNEGALHVACAPSRNVCRFRGGKGVEEIRSGRFSAAPGPAPTPGR